MLIIVSWCFVSSCIISPSSLACFVCSIGVLLMCSVMSVVLRGWNIVNCVLVGFGTRSLM